MKAGAAWFRRGRFRAILVVLALLAAFGVARWRGIGVDQQRAPSAGEATSATISANKEMAVELLARSYEQLGFGAESASWRNFYLSGAQELRSGQTGNGPDPALAIGLLAQAPVERYLDAMAAGLNGPKAEGSHFKLNLVFSDTGQSHVLWIENAVLHHRKAPPDPDANTTLTLTRSLFARLMTGTGNLKDIVLGDDLQIRGSRIDLLRFLGLIDKPPRGFAIVTPAN